MYDVCCIAKIPLRLSGRVPGLVSGEIYILDVLDCYRSKNHQIEIFAKANTTKLKNPPRQKPRHWKCRRGDLFNFVFFALAKFSISWFGLGRNFQIGGITTGVCSLPLLAGGITTGENRGEQTNFAYNPRKTRGEQTCIYRLGSKNMKYALNLTENRR